MLIDIVKGKYRSSAIQSWQKAALLLGLSEISSNYEENIKSFVNSHIDETGNWKEKIKNVDVCMLAYAILKCTDNKQRIKPAMDYAISVINDNLTADNYVTYTGGKTACTFYVDTIGLVCPFLMLYAKEYNEQRYEHLAYRQIEMYHNFAMYMNTELPNHAIDISRKLPLGVYGWGRGVAWYIIGLLDSYLNAYDSTVKESIRKLMFLAAESYKDFQSLDGGFSHILQMENGYDSSATAVLAWFYSCCARIFCEEEYLEISKKCLNKIKTVTRITGAIDWCQGDTKGIGTFALTYDIMPFAQGMTLRAVSVFEGRIITDEE